MRCPVDNTELKIAERSGIEIDYCPACRGVWLDRGELDKIIERSAAYELNARPGGPQPYDEARRLKPYDDDDDDDRRYPPRKRKRGFLDDVFDIFD